jgi:uncharacterized protein
LKKYLVYITRKESFSGNLISAHRDFLNKLRESGQLLLAGGFTDQTGGAYILQCDSYKEAENIILQDPMNHENETIYQLKEWNAN